MSTPEEDHLLRAWIDESGSIHALDPGTYILAAAIGPAHAEDHARHVMEHLRLPGQKKLHWRDENDRRHKTITDAIADLPHTHLVVVRTAAVTDKPQRRRNKCLERLLPELQQRGVTEAIFESRGPADDNRDLDLANKLRGRRLLGTALRIYHQPGPTEPLLSIPDAVAGAVTSHRTGTTTYLDTLTDHVTMITI